MLKILKHMLFGNSKSDSKKAGSSAVHTIGVRFEIDRVTSGNFGKTFWKVFWDALPPEVLKASQLYEGRTNETLSGREEVFCIGIQSMDPGVISKVQSAMERSEDFSKYRSGVPFVKGAMALTSLQTAGRVDSNGELLGEDAAVARWALGESRQRGIAGASTLTDSTGTPRLKPASSRTASLPEVDSFDGLVSYFGGVLGEQVSSPVTPEELCDVVEHYAHLIEVHVREYSCPVSESMACVDLFDRQSDPKKGKCYMGMYPFGSAQEAMRDCINRCGSSNEAEELARMRGIVGKWHLNFESSGSPEEHNAGNEIPATKLWDWICQRRRRLNIPQS